MEKENTMLLSEAITRFGRGLIGQGASKNTVESYRRHLKLLVKFFPEKNVEEIGPTDLNEFLYAVRLKENGSEKTPRTMNAINTAVKSFFKSLALKENPAERLRIKKVRIERDYIIQDEVRKLLDGVTVIRDRTIMAVLCLLGLRREEIAGVTVGEIKGPALRILGKGGVERDIPINASAREHLDRFLHWKEKHGESVELSAPLFVSRKGNPLSMNAIYNLVKKWTIKILGKELYPHALRHSFASMLVAKNVNIATIQRLMGHSSISMTEVYLHISNELKEDAVSRLDI
ncbi:MAG: tyrosine-type recombinase/integrase [Planctomycetes bacterium]|nr:tyrosine-type recombinase/integrase [Planctomycetota bacterium]